MNSHLHLKDKILKTAVFLFYLLPLLILVSCESRRLKAGAEATTITKTIVGNDGSEMMLIPAGEFQMGSNYHKYPTSDWYFPAIFLGYHTKPVHTVYLDAFYMDKYEVTNAQFRKFLQANPQWRKSGRFDRRYQHRDYLRDWDELYYPAGKADHPVVYVSWYAAAAYAQWAGKKLPTEAEWEKAARGGLVGREYPWGNRVAHDNASKPVGEEHLPEYPRRRSQISHDNANCAYVPNKGTGRRDKWADARDKWERTAPVGQFPPNGYGLHDMAGNVWEWCANEFDLAYYRKSPKHNPTGPGAVITFSNGDYMNVTSSRVLRGGSWENYTYSLRCANRCSGEPQLTDFSTGFRCASVRQGTVRQEHGQQRESHLQAIDEPNETLSPDSGNAEVHRKTETEAKPILKTMVGKDGTEMVLIPAGEFLMGSDRFAGAEKFTTPVRTVYVDAFYMDRYAVTNAQFRKFLQANPQWRKDGRFDRIYNQRVMPSHYLMHWDGMAYPEGKADYPAFLVSWYAAAAYARWVGKRLPTEAEWEKAARGGLVGKKYPWGDKLSRDHANFVATGGRDKWDWVAPVGRFLPNGYGLYDMAGNVFEWCADEHIYSNSSKYNLKPPSADITFRNRSYLSVKSARVMRSGNCWSGWESSQCALRFGAPPGSTHWTSSFRCVQDP